jgi:hypothetical protein
MNQLRQRVLDIEIITRIIEDITVFSSDDELWELLLLLLEKQTKAIATLWQQQGVSYCQVKSSPPDVFSFQGYVIERVFNTRTSHSVSYDNVTATDNPLLFSEIALPVFERQTLVGVLRLERSLPFEEEEHEVLRKLVRSVGGLLAPTQQEPSSKTLVSSLSEVRSYDSK